LAFEFTNATRIDSLSASADVRAELSNRSGLSLAEAFAANRNLASEGVEIAMPTCRHFGHFDLQMRTGLLDAFFTTKSNGMGMGLSWATANTPHGVTFQFTLPVDAETVS
jgi:hypothetical protein